VGGRAQSQWKVEVVGRVYETKVRKGAPSLGGIVGCSVSWVFSGNTAAFCWGKFVLSLFFAGVACFSRDCRAFLFF
jgi:hypothetical protein